MLNGLTPMPSDEEFEDELFSSAPAAALPGSKVPFEYVVAQMQLMLRSQHSHQPLIVPNSLPAAGFGIPRGAEAGNKIYPQFPYPRAPPLSLGIDGLRPINRPGFPQQGFLFPDRPDLTAQGRGPQPILPETTRATPVYSTHDLDVQEATRADPVHSDHDVDVHRYDASGPQDDGMLSEEEHALQPNRSRSGSFLDDAQSGSETSQMSRAVVKRKAKGKAKAKEANAEAGPSDTSRGRPTVEANLEIEEVGHRMQGELVALAEKHGMTYDTLLRKIGFSRQEVREPTIANMFRQVHKQRLLDNGEGMSFTLHAEAQLTFFKANKHPRSSMQPSRHGRLNMAATLQLLKICSKSMDRFSPVRQSPQNHQIFQSVSVLYLSRWQIWQVPASFDAFLVADAQQSNSYFMAHNVVVIGAVIYLGPTHASLTFAPNMGQQAALIKGFDIDEQECLLKAKAHLLCAFLAFPFRIVLTFHRLQAHVDSTSDVPAPVIPERWQLGTNQRDKLRRWVNNYLRDAIGKLLAFIRSP